MISKSFWSILLCIFLSAASAVGEEEGPTSPELERMVAQVAPLIFPTEYKDKVIMKPPIKGHPIQKLAEIYEAHGLEVVFSESVSSEPIPTGFYNLRMQHVLDLCAGYVNAYWVYDDGKVLVFGDPDELDPAVRERFELKQSLMKKISREKRRLENESIREYRAKNKN